MERIWHKHYDQGVPISLDIPDITLNEMFQEAVKTYATSRALIFFNNTLTYAQLDQLVTQFASALQQAGFQKGDRIALYMPNCPQYSIAYFGALRAGGIVVPSNPLYVPREIEHQVKDSGATFVVVLSLLYPRLKQVRNRLDLTKVIVANIKEYFPTILKLLFTLVKENKPDQNGERHRIDLSGEADTVWFQVFLNSATGQPRPVEIKSKDTAILMYTGGTTGVPKGAELTHGNLIANTYQSASWLTDVNRGKSTMMTALPLTHSYAMTICQNQAVHNGGAQVLIPNPRDLDDVLKNLVKHKVEYLPGVPTLYNAINNHPDVKNGKHDLRSIKSSISGAASLPESVQQAYMKITKGKLTEGYGLSEASPLVTANPMSGGKIGTIGVPVPETDLKIVDLETGTQALEPGEAGEICIKGPQVMRGYWNRPEETEKVLRTDEQGDIWLHTGDIGMMDEDGYFKIVDRKKDMIIAGGYNIYPNEVEDILYEHPAILEAAVVGVPDERRGEVVKAFVVLHEGESLEVEALRAWCKKEMRTYMVPSHVEFRDSLPKSMVGKIMRRLLLEEEQNNKSN